MVLRKWNIELTTFVDRKGRRNLIECFTPGGLAQQDSSMDTGLENIGYLVGKACVCVGGWGGQPESMAEIRAWRH